MRRTLIRNADLVMTMEPRLGDGELGLIPGGDVCIEDNRIAAVGKGLDGSGARIVDATGKIVLPGFVDVHNHLWQSLIRGCGTSGRGRLGAGLRVSRGPTQCHRRGSLRGRPPEYAGRALDWGDHGCRLESRLHSRLYPGECAGVARFRAALCLCLSWARRTRGGHASDEARHDRSQPSGLLADWWREPHDG